MLFRSILSINLRQTSREPSRKHRRAPATAPGNTRFNDTRDEENWEQEEEEEWYDEGHNTSSRTRYKEADTIDIPSKFPNAGNIANWKTALYKAVDAASGRRDDGVIPWLRQVESDEVSLSALRYTEAEFVTLDRKLAAALTKVCQGEFQRRLQHEECEQLERHNKTLRGRQEIGRAHV